MILRREKCPGTEQERLALTCDDCNMTVYHTFDLKDVDKAPYRFDFIEGIVRQMRLKLAEEGCAHVPEGR